MTDSTIAPRTFRPKPSFGWVWPLLTAVMGIVLLMTSRLGGEPSAFQAGLGILLIVLGLAVTMSFPFMRYVVNAENLTLSCGPAMRARIPLRAIKEVERADLVPSAWAAIRFPGLAIRTVRYVGVGPVRMCSTRAARGVTILRTEDRLYGISPEDEAGFLAAITHVGDGSHA